MGKHGNLRTPKKTVSHIGKSPKREKSSQNATWKTRIPSLAWTLLSLIIGFYIGPKMERIVEPLGDTVLARIAITIFGEQWHYWLLLGLLFFAYLWADNLGYFARIPNWLKMPVLLMGLSMLIVALSYSSDILAKAFSYGSDGNQFIPFGETNQPLEKEKFDETSTPSVTYTITESITQIGGGDIFDMKNVSNEQSDYLDPGYYTEGDRLRFHLILVNTGYVTADNVLVKFDISNPNLPRVVIDSDNTDSVTDVVTVQGTADSFRFVSGSIFTSGPPDCLQLCQLDDNLFESGISFNEIWPGELNSRQIAFEIDVLPIEPMQMFADENVFEAAIASEEEWEFKNPIFVTPGESLVLKIWIRNNSDIDATDVVVQVDLGVLSTIIEPKVSITGAYGTTIEDIVTVYITDETAQRLIVSGDTYLWGPNCEEGCLMPNDLFARGLRIDRIKPGPENSILLTVATQTIGE